MKEINETVATNSFAEVVQNGNKAFSPTNKILGPLPHVGYSATITFDQEKEMVLDAATASPTLTLSSTGAVNGTTVLVRINEPTAVNFAGVSSEAHPSSSAVDPTKLNFFLLTYFSNWDGNRTPKVIYTNVLYTAF